MVRAHESIFLPRFDEEKYICISKSVSTFLEALRLLGKNSIAVFLFFPRHCRKCFRGIAAFVLLRHCRKCVRGIAANVFAALPLAAWQCFFFAALPPMFRGTMVNLSLK